MSALALAVSVQLVVAIAGAAIAFGSYPAGTIAYLTPPAMLLAAPFLPFATFVLTPDPPFLRPGYCAVALWGPVVLLALSVPTKAGVVGTLALTAVYELGALAVAVAYVGLRLVGGWWLGDREHPRVGRRVALSAVLLASACAWTLFVAQEWQADGCLDRGGRLTERGHCEGVAPAVA